MHCPRAAGSRLLVGSGAWSRLRIAGAPANSRRRVSARGRLADGDADAALTFSVLARARCARGPLSRGVDYSARQLPVRGADKRAGERSERRAGTRPRAKPGAGPSRISVVRRRASANRQKTAVRRPVGARGSAARPQAPAATAPDRGGDDGEVAAIEDGWIVPPCRDICERVGADDEHHLRRRMAHPRELVEERARVRRLVGVESEITRDQGRVRLGGQRHHRKAMIDRDQRPGAVRGTLAGATGGCRPSAVRAAARCRVAVVDRIEVPRRCRPASFRAARRTRRPRRRHGRGSSSGWLLACAPPPRGCGVALLAATSATRFEFVPRPRASGGDRNALRPWSSTCRTSWSSRSGSSARHLRRRHYLDARRRCGPLATCPAVERQLARMISKSHLVAALSAKSRVDQHRRCAHVAEEALAEAGAGMGAFYSRTSATTKLRSSRRQPREVGTSVRDG